MPIKDVDGGLVWQGYSPSLFEHRTLPKEQMASNPFYFGGSQVPVGLNAPQLSSTHGSTIARAKNPTRRVVKLLPSVRKF